jgi:exonuclease III
LCETKLASGQTIKNAFPDYEIVSRPIKAGQKGIALCIKKNTFKSVLDVTSSTIKDIIVVRIEMSNSVVRVILGYAPQETEGIETRDEFFTELEIEVTKCKMVDELPIVVGDLNAKIHLQEGVIESITANYYSTWSITRNLMSLIITTNARGNGHTWSEQPTHHQSSIICCPANK